MPQFALAGRELVDPRHEQLLAFRISQHPHGAAEPSAVFEVIVHRGLFLLVAVERPWRSPRLEETPVLYFVKSVFRV